MKTSLSIAATSALLLLSATAFGAKKHYRATLTGGAENPAVMTSATGTATLTLDTTTMKLCGSVIYTGIMGNPYNAEIDEGAMGSPTASGVQFQVIPRTASPILVDLTLDAAHAMKLADLANNPMFINIWTAAHPTGELRGALADDPSGYDDPCGSIDGGAGPMDAGPAADSGAPSDAGPAGDAGAAKGGGGCSTAGHATGADALFALGLALAVLGSRSRRSTCHRTRPEKKHEP